MKTTLYIEVETLIGSPSARYPGAVNFPGLCLDLARAMGVLGADDAYDMCGLVGVVLICAEVLGDTAPPELLALASRLLTETEYPRAWRESYDRVLRACLSRRRP